MKRASAPSKREGASPAPTDKISIPPPPRLRPEQTSLPEGGEITPTAAIALGADLPAGRRGDHPPPPRLRSKRISPPEGGEITIPAPPRLQRCGVFRCGAPCGGPAGRGPGGMGSHPTPPPADFRVFYPMRGRRGCPRPAGRGQAPRPSPDQRKREKIMVKIAPSILSADFCNLERDINREIGRAHV